MSQIAEFLLSERTIPEWKERYDRLFTEIEAVENQLRTLGSPILFAKVLSDNRTTYEAMIETCFTLCLTDEPFQGKALEYAERLNARAFLDACRITGGFGIGIPATWKEERASLMAEIRYLGSGNVHKNETALRDAHLALGMLEQKVWELSREKTFCEDAWPVGMDDITRLLAPETALIEYIFLYNRLFAFVLCDGNLPHLFDMGVDRPQIAFSLAMAQLSIRLRENYTSHRKLEEELDLDEPWTGNDHLANLRDMLIKPLEGHLAGIRHLILVPTDSLWRVPFHALYRNDGVNRISLIEEYALSFAPSASALRMLTNRERITGPCYVTGVSSDSGGPVLSSQEAGRVADLLHTKAASGNKGELLASMDLCNIVHISSHSDTRNSVTSQNGLSMQEGLLLPADIIQARANLVVLSACASCNPDLLPDSQFSGLCGHFLRAGARTVIGSLWPVSSRAAYLLMEEFYTQLAAGSALPFALQAAQCKVMNEYSGHPFFWASFLMVGATG